MGAAEQDTGGVMASVRRIGRSLLGLVHTRVELFSLELQEEKLRLLRLVTWLAAGIALGAAGLLVTIGALALYLWKTVGYYGLVGLALATLAGSVAILWRIHHRITHGTPPFADTMDEFKKDAECLQDPN